MRRSRQFSNLVNRSMAVKGGFLLNRELRRDVRGQGEEGTVGETVR